jgi:hypothetical protein
MNHGCSYTAKVKPREEGGARELKVDIDGSKGPLSYLYWLERQ